MAVPEQFYGIPEQNQWNSRSNIITLVHSIGSSRSVLWQSRAVSGQFQIEYQNFGTFQWQLQSSSLAFQSKISAIPDQSLEFRYIPLAAPKQSCGNAEHFQSNPIQCNSRSSITTLVYSTDSSRSVLWQFGAVSERFQIKYYYFGIFHWQFQNNSIAFQSKISAILDQLLEFKYIPLAAPEQFYGNPEQFQCNS